jgi:hypothetical protein
VTRVALQFFGTQHLGAKHNAKIGLNGARNHRYRRAVAMRLASAHGSGYGDRATSGVRSGGWPCI